MKFRNGLAVVVTALVVGSTTALVSSTETGDLPGQQKTSVFAEPRIYRESIVLQQQLLAAFARKDYAVAEAVALRTTKLQPNRFASHFNLACAQARLNNADAAIDSVRKAIELGFRGAQRLQQDNDLAPLRNHEGWADLLKQAETPKPAATVRRVRPGKISGGVAMVNEENTAWEPALTQLRVFFEPAKAVTKGAKIIAGSDSVAKLLNEWSKEGTAAGLGSVLYDNHDRDHSNLNVNRYPQLTRIEYSKAAATDNLSNGLQHYFHFNRITFGNSSTSLVGGPYWRSQPRFAYTNTRSAEVLAFQYFRNHLYCYPEHRDYDPGTNGAGGYGDTYPANTPYVVISQGSSGSDRVFLDAIASTLAAFRPDVLKALQANGTVFSSVQMILRRCLKSVKTDNDYLSGIAHPPVFDGQQLDPLRMVKMAHSITMSNIPPIAVLAVQKETNAVPGRDYFDDSPRDKIFTTPAAIARVCRSTTGPKVITVDASKSRRKMDRKLSWHWVILQGDESRIEITPQNEEKSVAQISVRHHERRPIRPGSKMESSRVDIGVFVSNGTFYSAPSFVSFYWPEDERREYHQNGTIKSVQYTDYASGGPYTDPILVTPKTWTDEYLYSKSGKPIGWLRKRKDSEERFTADGALALTFDKQDRPLKAQTVVYIAKHRPNLTPILHQIPANEIREYSYDSDTDEVGRISGRSTVE